MAQDRCSGSSRTGRTAASALSLGVVLLGLVVPAGPALAHHGFDLDCPDFRYQEDAQEHMNAHPGDPDRLDGSPRDGVACEGLPHRPPGTPPPPPPPPPPPAPTDPCALSPLVVGAIREHYARLGGPCGFLRAPVTGELGTPDGRGRYNHFQGGSIYWTPTTGAREVHGLVRDTWARLGWERSALGYPVTDETRTPDGSGAYNHFEVGSVYWSPATGAHEVRGEIRRTWSRLGWERSALGYPVTDELPTPGTPGAYNHFQIGSVYWSPGTGAHEVRGAIRDAWAAAGWERSDLGFPVSDEYAAPGGRRSDFTGGHITWTPTGGAVVHRASVDLTGTVAARAVLDALATAVESTAPYDRDLFGGWTDDDGDGCDTRAEVLLAETLAPPVVDPGCVVRTGAWLSPYDGATWTDAGDVDIDHVVALSEAWDSGAAAWSAEQRRQFANDLGYDWSLQAVTDTVNASKGDSDPAEWLPPLPQAHCTYATRWVAVKYRWRLPVDDRERSALSGLLSGGCGAATLPAPPRAR